MAERVAETGEEIHAALAPFLDWEPRFKTQVVLVSNRDDFNAWATNIPYPAMRFFLVPPPSFTDLDSSDDWLRLSFFHEYAHILHLDTIGGFPKYLRYFLGNTISYGIFSPLWYLEGVAVYSESRFTGEGRIGAPLTEMTLRCAALEESIPSIDKINGWSPSWPWALMPYTFGGVFVDYLARTYGEDKLAEFNHAYSSGLPYALNSKAVDVFGKSWPRLWDEWRREVEKKYIAEYERISEAGLTESESLTDSGYLIMGPRFSPDGRWLAYSSQDADHFYSVKARDVLTGEDKILIPGRMAYSLAWSEDGRRVYLSRVANPISSLTERFYRYYDLFSYEIEDSRENRLKVRSRRLTRDARLINVDASRDGAKLIGVVQKMDRTDLAVLEPDGTGTRIITASEYNARWDTPRFSPDGTMIAASVSRQGNRDVVVLDTDGRELMRVTTHPWPDRDPCWSPDGRYLLFTSARTEIFNIHAFDMNSQILYQVTNVVGGAFQPEVSPDGGSLVFINYSARGYDLHSMPFDPGSWRPALRKPSSSEAHEPPPSTQLKQSEYRDHRYYPFRSLLPGYLDVAFGYYGGFSYLGLETSGTDALEQHMYLLNYQHSFSEEYSSGAALYRYDFMFAELAAFYQQVPVYYHDILYAPQPPGEDGIGPENLDVVEDDYYEIQRIIGAGFSGAPVIFKHGFRAGLYYHFEEREPVSEIPDEVTEESGLLPEEATFIGLDLGVVYSAGGYNEHGYAPVRSIGVESGLSFALSYELYREDWGSDFDLDVFTFDYRQYVPVPNLFHHVLAWRIHAGQAWGQDRVIPSFQMGGAYSDSIIPIPGTRHFSLRGFGIDQFWGEAAAAAYFEYRIPLTWAEHGWGVTPFYYEGSHLTLFADSGMVWGGELNRRLEYPEAFNLEDLNAGMGAEFNWRLRIGYTPGSDIDWKLGYVKDITGRGLGGIILLGAGVTF